MTVKIVNCCDGCDYTEEQKTGVSSTIQPVYFSLDRKSVV